jgi:hypothetical protein
MARIGVFDPVYACWQPAPRSRYEPRYIKQNAQWFCLSFAATKCKKSGVSQLIILAIQCKSEKIQNK